MPLHEDQSEANRSGLQAVNTVAKLAGGDTAFSAIVLPLTTVGVDATTATSYKKALYDLGLTLHEDTRQALLRANKAADAMRALGLYTDAAIAGADTTAGMRTIHQTAVVPNIAAADLIQQGGILYGE